MKSYSVFENLTSEDFLKITNELKSRFTLIEIPIPEDAKEAFTIIAKEGKINLTYYNTGRLRIQSSPKNMVYASIVEDISKLLSIKPNEKNDHIKRRE